MNDATEKGITADSCSEPQTPEALPPTLNLAELRGVISRMTGGTWTPDSTGYSTDRPGGFPDCPPDEIHPDDAGVCALRNAADELIRLAEIGMRAEEPEWFYDADESDRYGYSVHDVVKSAVDCGCGPGESLLIEVTGTRRCKTIWAVAHLYTDEEMEARGDDEDMRIMEFATEEEARAAILALEEGTLDED